MFFHSKGTAFKIFILVLITGIIGIAGVGIMQHRISKMTSSYEEMSDDYIDNCLKIDEVNSRLLSYRCTLLEMITSSDDEAAHLTRARELENQKQEVLKIMSELSEKMNSGVREQLYHKLYSNVHSYFNTAEVAHQIFDEGNINTALFYINTDLKTNVLSIEQSMQDMKTLTEDEMDAAHEEMLELTEKSKTIKNFCILIISIAVIICIYSCVTLASQLEKYKDKLEEELEEKNRELIEHNERIIKIQDNTISGLANLIESRDGETGGHIIRTSKYVEMLAHEARAEGYFTDILTDDYIELLVRSAPMHDIGKISISDLILKKQGKLTVEEFDIMKAHAAEGGKIIRNVMSDIENKNYVDMAAQVAEGHHEKWSGGGYPKGLSGEEIPLCARIMALADVFDALVSKRCYKEAFPFDKAFQIIAESSGTHFDPTLAEIFIKIRPEIEAAATELSDDVNKENAD
ncbi:MAG: HD-GYP domain-containing protein [Oscillospiraceae bacterium]